jgi:hypothetical protein
MISQVLSLTLLNVTKCAGPIVDKDKSPGVGGLVSKHCRASKYGLLAVTINIPKQFCYRGALYPPLLIVSHELRLYLHPYWVPRTRGALLSGLDSMP